MSIHELSFTSRDPILDLPYLRYEIRLQENCSSAELPRVLGRLAISLQKQYGLLILSDPINAVIFSPISLPNNSKLFTILAEKTVNLTEPSFSRMFFRVCNFALYRAFNQSSKRPKIDVYRKRIYSTKETQRLSETIEAQKYLTFDFVRDANQRLVFAPDFASEYRSFLTLERLNLDSLQPGQKLIDTYAGKSCDFSGIAAVTIATPLPELGNKSLIEYHREKNHISRSVLNSLDFSTAAVEVRYSQSGKRPFIAKHIPHLLKKVYDRKDIDSLSFEKQSWSIDQKVNKAKEIMIFLNQNNKFFLDFKERESWTVSFSNDLRQPGNLQNFNAAKLDFGNQTVVAYPNAALRRRQLREKPAEIKSVILHRPTGKIWYSDT